MVRLLMGMAVAVFLIVFSQFSDVRPERPIEVSYDRMIPTARTQIDCLAQNIYYEAGNQGHDGQLAVALVTMNRVQHGFSNSICSVVKQKTNDVCQFSWKCQKTKSPDPGLYREVQRVALYVYLNYGQIDDITHGATYYHADYVKPQWDMLKKTVKIGQHIFYKNKKELNHDEQTKYSTRWQGWTKGKFLLSLNERD